jgi:phosphoribosylaminoimidazolecarboxamide formyltransferase/IMP cyclohydrolase
MRKINQALISVSDKTGLIELATYLKSKSIKILSTGGTSKALKNESIEVLEVSDYTGFHEMLDGRVKTLHPKVHAGILHRRDIADHVAQMVTKGWPGIDLVVVNLYPFEKVAANPKATFEEAIENIDIGGPCLLRASAKNHAHVAVLCDPSDYGEFINQMDSNNGELSPAFRRKLAFKAYSRTSAYDKTISEYLKERIE